MANQAVGPWLSHPDRKSLKRRTEAFVPPLFKTVALVSSASRLKICEKLQ